MRPLRQHYTTILVCMHLMLALLVLAECPWRRKIRNKDKIDPRKLEYPALGGIPRFQNVKWRKIRFSSVAVEETMS